MIEKIKPCPKCKTKLRENIVFNGKRKIKVYDLENGKIIKKDYFIRVLKCKKCNYHYDFDKSTFATDKVISYVKDLKKDYLIKDIIKITNLNRYIINKILNTN